MGCSALFLFLFFSKQSAHEGHASLLLHPPPPRRTAPAAERGSSAAPHCLPHSPCAPPSCCTAAAAAPAGTAASFALPFPVWRHAAGGFENGEEGGAAVSGNGRAAAGPGPCPGWGARGWGPPFCSVVTRRGRVPAVGRARWVWRGRMRRPPPGDEGCGPTSAQFVACRDLSRARDLFWWYLKRRGLVRGCSVWAPSVNNIRPLRRTEGNAFH